MTLGTSAFRASIGKWAAKASPDGMAALARVAIQDLAERVIDDTPVDTGFLVGSWQPALNEPNTGTGDPDPGRAMGGPHIAVAIKELKVGDIFYYTNAVEYAKYQEYGTAHIAGRHMVARNIADWDNIVQNAATKLGMTQ